MSNKKRISDVDVAGRRVLMRVDFNVPQDRSGAITDDRRIRGALASIHSVISRGGRLILMSHLGRPNNAPDPVYSLQPVSVRLRELLGKSVAFATDTVGPDARSKAQAIGPGDVLLLENLRFHPGEKAGDPTFARQLAEMADIYCNDAFGTCHRMDASMVAVPMAMPGKPRVIGFLVEKEIRYLHGALTDPDRPFVVVLGGSKVSDKLPLIGNLLPRCDRLLIGGAMAYPFSLARGRKVGASKVDPNDVPLAKMLWMLAGSKIFLPIDDTCGDSPKGGTLQVCEASMPVPDWKRALDIGPETATLYSLLIKGAGMVLWNGPLGMFEYPPFDQGSAIVAKTIAEETEKRGIVSIVGGGDTALLIDRLSLSDRFTHVSTGGGASLEMLGNQPLGALDVLDSL